MRRVIAAAFVVLLLASLAPTGQAAINKPRAFSEAFPYMAGIEEGGEMTVVSGDAEATLAGAPGSFGFFGIGGLTVSGLTRECHGASCNAATSIQVPVGGSAALCFPSQPTGDFAAGHVLGLFVDLAQDDDLNGFPVDKALVASAVDGVFTFGPIASIPTPLGGILTNACGSQGGIAALDDTTQLVIRNGNSIVTTLNGKGARVAFTGSPTVTPVAADTYMLPFNGGSTARFTPASAGDAKEGLDLERVLDVRRQLEDADAQDTSTDDPAESRAGNNTQAFLGGLLNGALFKGSLPSEGQSFDFEQAHFIRFSRLEVTGTGSGNLAWSGKAYLEVQDGKVDGAKPLVGFWIFKLPWWSYVLWAIAITLAIIRLVTKPDKNHPRWDPLRWIGWVATPVAWIIVFLLWDLEVHAVLGASLLRGPGGQFRLIVGLLQVGLLAIVAFAAAAPLRVIGRNAFLLAHQGTFMGVSGAVAAFLGFLFGAPYLRAYLGVLLTQVMDKLG